MVNSTASASNIVAPTQFVTAGDNTYAYRQFGSGSGLPLLFLQHFTGTLDNWDLQLPILSRSAGESSFSRARVSDALMERCQRLSLAWRITH